MLWLSTQVQVPEGFLFSQVATATCTASFSSKTWQALACMRAGLLGEGGGKTAPFGNSKYSCAQDEEKQRCQAVQSGGVPKLALHAYTPAVCWKGSKSDAIRQVNTEVCPSFSCMHTSLLSVPVCTCSRML